MRKRNCRVEVCFTKDELSALSKKAKKAGMSIGGFIRHSVANKEVKEAPPADVPYLIRAMRQAGYNLDQTLKRFNSTNVPDMDEEHFKNFMNSVHLRQLYDTGVDAEYGDHLITLSTCEYTYTNGRFVVVAKKV